MNRQNVCTIDDNPLCKLMSMGQHIWLDDLSRALLASERLWKLMEYDGVTGLMSNPAIVGKAIHDGADYGEAIVRRAQEGWSPEAMLREIMFEDAVRAADALQSVHEWSRGSTGFVSLAMSPLLAHDAGATVREASEWWSGLGRRNVLIEVPATSAGLVALRRLTAAGVNTRVTLLFGLGRYQQACEAWLGGLEDRRAEGGDLAGITSVASFFLSSIDSRIDAELRQFAALNLVGRTAIASAKLAHAHFERLRDSSRFRRLADKGAQPQRLLWAGTGVEDPAYPAVKYVEELIGEGTITTLPEETLAAYREHGNPRPRLHEGMAEAREVLDELPAMGLNLQALVSALEEEGLRKCLESHRAVLASLQATCDNAAASHGAR